MDMNPERVDYRTEPSRYRHWKLAFDGPVATLAMDVAEDILRAEAAGKLAGDAVLDLRDLA